MDGIVIGVTHSAPMCAGPADRWQEEMPSSVHPLRRVKFDYEQRLTRVCARNTLVCQRSSHTIFQCM
jgi:hypothetical protein